MPIYEEDSFKPNPEWKDWELTLVTVEDIIDQPVGSSVGKVALLETEILASQSQQEKVGEKARRSIPLGVDTTFWNLDVHSRKFVCLGDQAELEVGGAFLVATYYWDSENGSSRNAVTAQRRV